MSDIFDLYGILATDIDTAATVLAEALNVPFEPHDSSYWGEYYLGYNIKDKTEKFSLKENFNKMEDEWNEPTFRDYPLTLEVSLHSLTRAREIEENTIKAMGAKIALLRRNAFPDKEER